MRSQHLSRDRRASRAAYWFSLVSLSAFVVWSFLGARRLYLDRCGHAATSRHTALLLALVLWSSLLAVQVFAGVIRRRQTSADASSEPPGR
jgi:hypothetical protein